MIFLGFWDEPANSFGSPHTNFGLLFTFEVLNIILFEIFYISIGRFGVSIAFLCFGVELANFV
jgi:hypothetical protein